MGQVEAVVTGSYSISWSAPRLARPSEDGSELRSSPGEGHLTITGSLEVNDLCLSSKPLSSSVQHGSTHSSSVLRKQGRRPG